MSPTPQTEELTLGQRVRLRATRRACSCQKLLRARPLFDREILRRAAKASLAKLNPATLLKNPVIFVVEVGATLTTIFVVRDIVTGGAHTGVGFAIQIAVLAMVHCRVREFRRGDGGGSRVKPRLTPYEGPKAILWAAASWRMAA